MGRIMFREDGMLTVWGDIDLAYVAEQDDDSDTCKCVFSDESDNTVTVNELSVEDAENLLMSFYNKGMCDLSDFNVELEFSEEDDE